MSRFKERRAPRRSRTIVSWAGVAVLILALGVLAWRQHRALTSLHARVDSLCSRMELDLAHVANFDDAIELRAKMVHRFLNAGISELCLGSEAPIDIDDASLCWIRTGRSSCYLLAAKELSGRYRARERYRR